MRSIFLDRMEPADRSVRHNPMVLPPRTQRRISALLAIPLIFIAAGCGATETEGGGPSSLGSDAARVSVAPADATALGDVVAAADVMGLDLIRAGGGATTVTSPASLQVALSMAAEGAEGQTLMELEALLGASGQDRSNAFNALTAALEHLDGDRRSSRATSCRSLRWCTARMV